MLKTTLFGTVIDETPCMIVMQEGIAVARYSKDFYRLPNDQDKASEPVAVVWVDELPVKIDVNGVLVPVYS